ncbi:MAG: helix-turn-helix domain-containing protein [Desulfobulbus sp.]|nr:helix-turn-helix domain-containing protein [Desulfobulbus sp.]
MDFKDNFKEAWERIRGETGIKSQKELAELLRISPSAITDMKKTGKFPEKWAFIIESRLGLKSEWITGGKEPKRLEKRAFKSKFDILNEVEAWLEEITIKEPYRKEWFQAELEDKFPSFKAWKEEKKGQSEIKEDWPVSKVA